MNIINSFKQKVFSLYRNKVIAQHPLDYLFWECTLRCNLNCLHCGSDCLKSSTCKDMPIEDFITVLDDIKQNFPDKKLTICITGGEPLLRKDLEKAGEEIVKRGFSWGIVSNAVMLDSNRLMSLINSGMSSLSLSLDGFENEHNTLRQNNLAFKKTTEALSLITDLNRRFNFTYDVITCVSQLNLKTLPQFRDFLITSGVNRWRIFSIFPSGRAEKNIDNLSLTKPEFQSLLEFIASTRKNYSSKIRLNYSCEGYLGDYELKVRDYFYFCRAGINVASVMCNGDVTGCLSVRSKDLIQGNIYNESFSKIWNTKFSLMRNRSWTKKGKCKDCKFWNNCLGGPMHLYNSISENIRCWVK